MAIAIFGHYTNSTGNTLPAALAFSTLSLFNTLRFPLVVLPNSVRAYSAASTAYARIRSFLNSARATDTRQIAKINGLVEIEGLPVGPNKTVLHKWSAQPGELWVFQGPVRSYKSACSPPHSLAASVAAAAAHSCCCAFMLLLQAHCSRPSPATSPSPLTPACGWGAE